MVIYLPSQSWGEDCSYRVGYFVCLVVGGGGGGGGGVKVESWVFLSLSSKAECSTTGCKSMLFKEVLSACFPGGERGGGGVGGVINLLLPIGEEEFVKCQSVFQLWTAREG